MKFESLIGIISNPFNLNPLHSESERVQNFKIYMSGVFLAMSAASFLWYRKEYGFMLGSILDVRQNSDASSIGLPKNKVNKMVFNVHLIQVASFLWAFWGLPPSLNSSRIYNFLFLSTLLSFVLTSGLAPGDREDKDHEITYYYYDSVLPGPIQNLKVLVLKRYFCLPYLSMLIVAVATAKLMYVKMKGL